MPGVAESKEPVVAFAYELDAAFAWSGATTTLMC
jgi:hypothetical protein